MTLLNQERLYHWRRLFPNWYFSRILWKAEQRRPQRWQRACNAPFYSLKGVWHAIFSFKFFLWISVPRAPEYPTGPFRIFSKICRDFREWMSLTPAINFRLFVYFWPVNYFSAVLLTPAINFRLLDYFWPVSMTPGTVLWNRNRNRSNRNFLTSGTGSGNETVTCSKVGTKTGTIISYGFGTGTT